MKRRDDNHYHKHDKVIDMTSTDCAIEYVRTLSLPNQLSLPVEYLETHCYKLYI